MRADFARSLYRSIARRVERYRRQRIRFRIGGFSTRPTVYFLADDFDRPAGGTMIIYRHVDMLNASGIRARALHRRPGFRYSWFENDTATATLGATRFGRGDLLVVPELDVDLLARMPVAMRHVIFNQSGHLTWKRARDAVNSHYLHSPELAAVVVVSDHSRALLRHAFGGLDIRRVHLGVDPRLFFPPPGPRPKRLAYMPRLGGSDAELVLTLLANRGMLAGWEVMRLDALPHAELARQLRSTCIFLSFPYQEGFGLAALEAMACGAYVVGYDGYGGHEYFRPAFSARLETGDVLGAARAVEEAMAMERAAPGWCEERGLRAAAFVRRHYTLEREREEVADLYRGLLDGSPRATRALALAGGV